MNFLAHLALSCEDPHLQMGNFLGDYTKGRTPEHYPEGVQRGIVLHRLIDAKTDAHPVTHEIADRLKHRHGRYSGVVSDVIFDLYLYRNWNSLGLPPFPGFADRTYANLLDNLDYLDEKMVARIHRMVDARWLDTYTSKEGILQVFQRMKKRFSKPQFIQGIDKTLEEEDEAFNQAFLQLFPDLQLTVTEFCDCS